MAEQLDNDVASQTIKARVEPYDLDDSFAPSNGLDPRSIRSVPELLALLHKDESIQVEARVLSYNPKTKERGVKKLDRKQFLEAFRTGEASFEGVNLREAEDVFGTDAGGYGDPGLVGQSDFVPLLGGPFYKNLYFYDYIRQSNAAFWAWNHDPIAHQAINIIRDFTLGRGYRIDCDNEAALALWRAFEKTNDVQTLMKQIALELSLYGETMIWKLPDQQTKIVQNWTLGQQIPKGLIPRVRLIDPTVIWEIVTWPEDITKVLYYVWVAPTQYQVYSGLERDKPVNSFKFIFQTIPPEQINHYKVNQVSNEKRGRSDLFSVLGFLKRLRDSVNYSVISLQKQASYCIDTTVEGSQADIQAYIDDQQAQGTIAPAGSEFVHTSKIKREYKGVEGGKIGANPTFEWCLSMVASGMGIPISYFGTHMSGGQTRASAIVATEPVAKRFEMRQAMYEKIIQDLWDYVMDWAGLGNVDCEITFPELITQDRSQKLKDLMAAEASQWISKERAANMAAKELNITNYDYSMEKEVIDKTHDDIAAMMPLISGGQVPSPGGALPGVDRNQVKGENV
jgi:hypothetical protein